MELPLTHTQIQNKQKTKFSRFATAWTFLFRKGTSGPTELATPTLRESPALRLPNALGCGKTKACPIPVNSKTWKKFLVKLESLRRRAVTITAPMPSFRGLQVLILPRTLHTEPQRDTRRWGRTYPALAHTLRGGLPRPLLLSSQEPGTFQRNKTGPVRVVSVKAKRVTKWLCTTESSMARGPLFS